MRLVIQAVGTPDRHLFRPAMAAGEKRETKLVVIGLHEWDFGAVIEAVAGRRLSRSRQCTFCSPRKARLPIVTRPIDLGQTPGDILFLSAADTELAALPRLWRCEDGPLRARKPDGFKHPMSVDTYIERTPDMPS